MNKLRLIFVFGLMIAVLLGCGKDDKIENPSALTLSKSLFYGRWHMTETRVWTIDPEPTKRTFDITISENRIEGWDKNEWGEGYTWGASQVTPNIQGDIKYFIPVINEDTHTNREFPAGFMIVTVVVSVINKYTCISFAYINAARDKILLLTDESPSANYVKQDESNEEGRVHLILNKQP